VPTSGVGAVVARVTVKDKGGQAWTGEDQLLVIGEADEPVEQVPNLTLASLSGTLEPGDSAQLVALLPHKAESYGKGAIVGVNGDLEHAAALCHPKMGKPMRAALGGGEALIPSTQRVAAGGETLDLPLGHKDNPWSFDHFETVTVGVPDAPRPDEIVVAIGIADGGRVNPRVGKQRIL